MVPIAIVVVRSWVATQLSIPHCWFCILYIRLAMTSMYSPDFVFSLTWVPNISFFRATSLVYDYIINSTAIWVSSAVVNASFWLNDITNNTYAGIWNAYEQTHGLNELVVIYPPLFGSYYPTSGRWTGIYGLFDVANNVVYYVRLPPPPT